MRHWLCASLLLSSTAYALDMGDIKVTSGFNEPLVATIPIDLSPNTKPSDYKISLQGLPTDLPAIQIALDPTGMIKLTSQEPISHNYIQFNVLTKAPDEELRHAYTITFNKKSAAKGPKPLVYGPVKTGETLWNVAKAFSEHYSIPVDEAMKQLYEQNPKAFVQGKKDALMAGSYLRLPQKQTAPALKLAKTTTKKIAAAPKIETPKVQEIKQAVSEEIAAVLPPLPDVQTDGKNVAVNLDKITGSLELLNPSEAVHSILGKDDQAFVALINKIQSELTLSRDAIDTERRAKEALQMQLNDVQLQLKALTELIHLKDEEMKSMLTQSHVVGHPAPLPQDTRFVAWEEMPSDTASFLSAAVHNQLVLLLMAIAVASFIVYVWDHLSMRRNLVPVNPNVQGTDKASTVKTQSLQQPGFMLKDIDVYVAHGRYSQAEDLLEQALNQNPNDFDLLYKLFQVYVKSDNRFAYEDKTKRISTRWKQKFPARWKRVHDLYERAWPMGFEGHGSGGGGGSSDEAYEGDPPSDPVQTKLDLAKAYIDIGNHENAVEILIEVVNEGNEAQVLAAQMLLSNIKH